MKVKDFLSKVNKNDLVKIFLEEDVVAICNKKKPLEEKYRNCEIEEITFFGNALCVSIKASTTPT